MKHTEFHFPRPLSAVLSRLPQQPPTLAFIQLLNLLLQPVLHWQDLQTLQGRHVAIRVNDLGLQFHFSIGRNRFLPARRTAPVDLLIAATAHDFYLLINRSEDPDSLFFNQRLLLEGDTELGLIAKNTLDSIELSPSSWLQAQLSRMKTRHTTIKEIFGKHHGTTSAL